MAVKKVKKASAVKKTAVSAPVRKERATSKPSTAAKVQVQKAKSAKAGKKVVVKGPVAKGASVAAIKAATAIKTGLTEKDLTAIREQLLRMRDRVTGQISSLANDSLKYVDDTSSEDRTDDFDREFALNLVSSEHDSLYEINDALRRIEQGVYGVCDGCNCPIERPRLQALPFARMCVRCQSEAEKGTTRFRPFGDTLAQGVEPSAENPENEPEETE